MAHCKLSIIMPLYNRIESEYRLLSKLKSQIDDSGADVEVIVINDGSTEELEYLDSVIHLCREAGFRYVEQDNGGESYARNQGMRLMTGDFFIFLDCDDDIVDDYIENLSGEMDKSYDLVAFKWKYMESGETGAWHDKPIVNWNVWSYLFNSRYFKDTEFDENMNVASDYFYLEKYAKDARVKYTDKMVVIYNAGNPQSLSNRFARGEIKARKEEE